MTETHRQDTPERKHYTVDRKSLVNINPVMLYSGALSKTQDWRDATHSHYFLEIIFIVDGKGFVELDGKRFDIAKHDIVVYNADVMHFEQSSSDEPVEADFIAFDKIHLNGLPLNCILPQNANCIFNADKFAQKLTQLFDIIRDEITAKDEFYAEIAKDASRTLLMYIFRILNRTASNVSLLNKDNILNVVMPYIEKNFYKNIGLGDIAAECFINKFHLSHVFTENFGMSVGQYIRDKKIEMAKDHIEKTELSISEIAERCGFNDLTYFDRLFKKSTGLTPRQYRKNYNDALKKD